MTLADLKIGEEAVIDCLNVDDKAYHRRLNGLGFHCGFRVSVIRQAPFNGPLQVNVGNSTSLVVRKVDAENIIVRKE